MEGFPRDAVKQTHNWAYINSDCMLSSQKSLATCVSARVRDFLFNREAPVLQRYRTSIISL